MYLGKFEYISNVDSATYVVWGETFCTPGWSIGSVNKRGAGYLRQKLFGWKNKMMFTCFASARLKNVTRWVRRGADDCSSNFLYSSDLALTAKRI